MTAGSTWEFPTTRGRNFQGIQTLNPEIGTPGGEPIKVDVIQTAGLNRFGFIYLVVVGEEPWQRAAMILRPRSRTVYVLEPISVNVD